MKKVILGLLLMFSTSVSAGVLPEGSKLFIAPMHNSLEQFISAEIIKQKLPIVVTMDEENATYVLVGSSVDKGSNSKWYDVMFGTPGSRDSVQASVTLVRKEDKAVVWANNQGDRSLFLGIMKRGGERKVALRLVKAMKKELFKK